MRFGPVAVAVVVEHDLPHPPGQVAESVAPLAVGEDLPPVFQDDPRARKRHVASAVVVAVAVGVQVNPAAQGAAALLEDALHHANARVALAAVAHQSAGPHALRGHAVRDGVGRPGQHTHSVADPAAHVFTGGHRQVSPGQVAAVHPRLGFGQRAIGRGAAGQVAQVRVGVVDDRGVERNRAAAHQDKRVGQHVAHLYELGADLLLNVEPHLDHDLHRGVHGVAQRGVGRAGDVEVEREVSGLFVGSHGHPGHVAGPFAGIEGG